MMIDIKYFAKVIIFVMKIKGFEQSLLQSFFRLDKQDNLVPFFKINSSSNDFVFLLGSDDLSIFSRNGSKIDISIDTIIKICDKKQGIGCDQLFIISSLTKEVIELQIYNADGSRAGNCGNGIRAISGYFFGIFEDLKECTIKILYNGDKREIRCKKLENGLSEIEMGDIIVKNINNKEVFDIGNKHIVLDCSEVKPEEVDTFFISKGQSFYPILKNITPDPDFNTNYINIIDSDRIGVTTLERGVGVTQCCGSGSCASVAQCVSKDKLEANHMIQILTEGSFNKKDMFVKIEKNIDGEMKAKLIGGYNFNFYGNLTPDFLK